MLFVIKWLYQWILPIGGFFTLLVGLLFYMFRKKAAGRWCLLCLTLALYALSIAPVSRLLLQPLELAYVQPAAAGLPGDVVVLLGGGARAGVRDVDGTGQTGSAAANRLLTAVRVQKAKAVPIILSGGAVFPGDADEAAIEKRVLLSLGVAEKDIYLDEKSRNTAENAQYTSALCRDHGWQHPVVVTSAFHMPRAIRFFEREGLAPIHYPCDYRSDIETVVTAFSFIPQSYVLYQSCLAINEYVGLGAAYAGLQ